MVVPSPATSLVLVETSLHQLCAHVLKGIGQLHFLGDADAVVGDEGSAVLLIQNNVAALGTQRDLYGIGQSVNAGLQSLAGFIAAHNELRHNSYLRIFLKVGDCVPFARKGHAASVKQQSC